VDGLVDGIYHYDARAHQLELRRAGNVHADLADMTIGQDMIKDANLVVLISAIRERTMWKYGQRGYRYVWLDAGHVGQNLYLVAEALGLGAAAIGGFFDGEVNRLLALPPQEEAIYLVCVGQPRP
jgi:SagB-type dehydrogenase family enzyme